jgi:hypothetical protein
MYSNIPIHWNIKSAPASPGGSRVGPALYVFSFLGLKSPLRERERENERDRETERANERET